MSVAICSKAGPRLEARLWFSLSDAEPCFPLGEKASTEWVG
jgi:hypothetical protein